MTDEERRWCQHMLDELETVDDLTSWEANFVDDLMNRLAAGADLSRGAIEKLEEIYDERA